MSAREQQKGALTNVVAERTVIGAALRLDSIFYHISEVLRAEHFTLKIHREIYTTIRDILFGGKKITLNAMVSALGEEYGDGASTANYLGALLRDAEDQTDVLDYVENIVDLWRRRKALEIAQWAQQQAGKLEESSSDMIGEMERLIHDVGLGGQTVPLKRIGQITRSVMITADRSRESKHIPGIDTGLPSLDEILGRIHPGDLGIVAASQGDGKTIMAVQLARRAALYGPVLLYELEMRDSDIGRRVLSAEASVGVRDIEEGTYDFAAYDNLVDAVKRMENEPFYIDDRPRLKWEQMRERAIAMKRSHGLSMIVGDHLRLARTGLRFRDKFERIEYITGESKALAKELDVPFIWLSQRTRTSQRTEDGVPQITDMDGGSSIEQDADWIITMFRRDKWLLSRKPSEQDSRDMDRWKAKYDRVKGKVEVSVLKRRRGESGEMREFWFVGRAGRIEEVEGR